MKKAPFEFFELKLKNMLGARFARHANLLRISFFKKLDGFANYDMTASIGNVFIHSFEAGVKIKF